MDHFTTLIGLIAGTLTTMCYLPQVIRTWRTRSARDISLSMLVALDTGIFLWFWYGILIHSFPVILFNGIGFVLVSTMVFMKLFFEKQ